MINRIESRGRNVFIITEVGQLYLEEYKKFDDFTKSMGLELWSVWGVVIKLDTLTNGKLDLALGLKVRVHGDHRVTVGSGRYALRVWSMQKNIGLYWRRITNGHAINW